jgi:hypothetical protein
MAASGPRFQFIHLGIRAEYVVDGSGYFRLSTFNDRTTRIDRALIK